MSLKTKTTITDASTDGRQRVQGMGDDNRGGSGSTTGPVDWQWQRSVDCPCYRVANSSTVLSLSIHCLVLILFSSDSFSSFASRNTISAAIVQKIFLYQVYNKFAYVPPTYRRVKKLRVLMINKDVCKSLARKKGNEILI